MSSNQGSGYSNIEALRDIGPKGEHDGAIEVASDRLGAVSGAVRRLEAVVSLLPEGQRHELLSGQRSADATYYHSPARDTEEQLTQQYAMGESARKQIQSMESSSSHDITAHAPQGDVSEAQRQHFDYIHGLIADQHRNGSGSSPSWN